MVALHGPSRTFYLRAETERERDAWLAELRKWAAVNKAAEVGACGLLFLKKVSFFCVYLIFLFIKISSSFTFFYSFFFPLL